MKCSITDFGARCADTLQTDAIQKAIDTCFLAGGGEVRVPAGVYRMGCIRLRSHVKLYLESGAILEGSTDPEDYTGYINDTLEPITAEPPANFIRSVYPFSRWNNAMIRVIDAEDVAVIGEKGSYIDGMNCFDAQGEEHYRGPHGINIQNTRGIRLEGYTLRRCGNWAHAIFCSQDITARNLTVLGGHDGFDVRTCDNVLIEDCSFITGDDALAGFDNNDVIVRRCLFDTACVAVRFGGNHVLVEDCRSRAPSSYGFRHGLTQEMKYENRETNPGCRHNMLDVFLYYCDQRADPRRTPGDILIRNCTFENPDRLFSLEFDGEHKWCTNRSLSQIRFENCIVDGVCKPVHIYGDAAEPLTFELENVTISAREGAFQEMVIDARNYERIELSHVSLNGFSSPAVRLHTEGAVSFEDSTELTLLRDKKE